MHLGRFTVTLNYCTNIFYLPLTNYIYYINSLCQSDVGKTEMGYSCKLCNMYSTYICGKCALVALL